jgi:hypothetical protein
MSKKKIDVYLDGDKLARVASKVLNLLVKKTRTPYEAYAVLLVVKKAMESECSLKEVEFDPVVESLDNRS